MGKPSVGQTGRARAARGSRLTVRHPAQAMVEFALTVSFMSLLMVGVVDFARVFYFDVVTSGAAMEAARSSASGLPDSDLINVAKTSAPTWMQDGLTVTINPPSSTRKRLGESTTYNPMWTTATVTYNFTPLTPLAVAFMGNSHLLTRKVSQRMRTPCSDSSTATC
jgi:Flp pilus assembly protein TadG